MRRVPWWVIGLMFNGVFWMGVATHRAAVRVDADEARESRIQELEEQLAAQKERTEVEYWARQCDRKIREAGCTP